jgi:hypothetical protein
VSPRTRRASPEDMRKIAAHARQHLPCDSCGAAAGEPCTNPGRGRSVCKPRYIAAAVDGEIGTLIPRDEIREFFSREPSRR